MKMKRIMGFFLALVMFMGYLPLNPIASYANGDVKIDKTNFEDDEFRKYVKDNFDTNPRDGYLSQTELDKVEMISINNHSVSSLKGIEHFKNLTTLDCSGNNLTSLDLSKNTNLGILTCSGNNLKSLDLSKNIKLSQLDCRVNNLTSLDLSKNTNLEILDCNKNNLTSLDLSKNIKLSQLTCSGNNLKSLDLSKNTNLEILDCNKNNLTSLDLSKNTNLEELNAPKNPLVSIRLVRKEDAISSTYGCCFDLTPAQYTVKVKKGSKKVPFNKLPQGFDKNKIIESDVKLEEDGFTWDGSTNPIKFRYKFCENPNEVENPEIADAGAEITVTEIEFDPEHVESMVVKKQPKLIYTEGEKLDLSELVVTLTDNQGLTKDVAFKDFKENNITANPENETELKLADSGKKVTLTKGNLTAQTNALTVKTKVTPSPLPTPTDPPVVRPVDPKDPNTKKPDTSKYYTVTFESEDETKGVVDAKNKFYVLKTAHKTLADIIAPKVTAKAGYEFDKWNPTLDKNTVIDKDLTVKAYFKKVNASKKPQVANNKALPKTASSMNIELYTFLMILSAGLFVVAFKRKKES